MSVSLMVAMTILAQFPAAPPWPLARETYEPPPLPTLMSTYDEALLYARVRQGYNPFARDLKRVPGSMPTPDYRVPSLEFGGLPLEPTIIPPSDAWIQAQAQAWAQAQAIATRVDSVSSSSRSRTVSVRAYTRKDGTQVRTHTRSAPRSR